MSLQEEVIRTYLSSSAGVHVAMTPADTAAYVNAYRRYLQSWLPVGAGRRWHDLGCGQGQLLRLARSLGFAVSGVDASAEMVRMATSDGLAVTCGDVFADVRSHAAGSLDVVSCFDLLEHVPKEDGYRLLVEIRRILRQNGLLLLKLPNAYTPFGFGITANDLTHEAAYTEATVLQLGKVAGYVAGEVREVGPQPKSAAGFVRWVLWRVLRFGLRAFDTIETGSSRTRIYTRVMLVRLTTGG